jgi:aminoglycoside 3-N-acetyltransferase
MFSYFKTTALFIFIRKIRYRIKRLEVKQQKKMELSTLNEIVVSDFKIEIGDTLFVHCGFGFLNANFTPQELITLLKIIVGENGNVIMPFYPPGLSSDWAKSGRIFDPSKIRCSTGVLAQVFSKGKDVHISCHPTKSVCAWGSKAKELVESHEVANYPYDKASPYFKAAMCEASKTIGIGVSNCSMIHCVEDVYEKDKSYLYSDHKFDLKFSLDEKIISVPTSIHHGEIKLMTSEEYFELHLPEIVNAVNRDKKFFYCIDNSVLFDKCGDLLAKGISRKIL